MGRKRSRARQYIYFCITGLISLSLASCAPLEKSQRETKMEEPYQSLLHSQKLLAQGDFEGSLRENQKVLSLGLRRPPADEALFNIGLIYAHPGNPNKDYVKSLAFFKRLMRDYPQSSLLEQAKTWTSMFQEMEKLRQTVEKPKQEFPKIEKRDEAREFLLHGQRLFAQGDFEGALRENQKVLSLGVRRPPEDEALFNIGLVYAHPGNPKKDYGKSLAFFKRLIKDYPQSSLLEQAKTWVSMLQEREKLNQTIEELSQVIEKSKQVDLEIEEKKRKEKTK